MDGRPELHRAWIPLKPCPSPKPLITANFTNWDQHLNYWLPSGPGGTGGLQMPLHTQVTGICSSLRLVSSGVVSWLLALLSVSSLGDCGSVLVLSLNTC